MDLGEIRVSVDEESVARAAATIREAGKQLHEALGRLEVYAVEHWTIYTVDGAGGAQDANARAGDHSPSG